MIDHTLERELVDLALATSGAIVRRPDGTVRKVTNLGWLLRHWRDLDYGATAFAVRGWRYGEYNGFSAIPHITHDPVMLAFCEDGTIYATKWADPGALLDWLDRPVFKGHILRWDYRSTTYAKAPHHCAIGYADYAQIRSDLAQYRLRQREERERLAAAV